MHLTLHDRVPVCYTVAELIAALDQSIAWHEAEYHACGDWMEAGKYGAAANRLKQERAQLIAGKTN